jgi:hypothetical protein
VSQSKEPKVFFWHFPVLCFRAPSIRATGSCCAIADPKLTSLLAANHSQIRFGAGRAMMIAAISPLPAWLLVHVLSARPSPAQIAAERNKQTIADKFARPGAI